MLRFSVNFWLVKFTLTLSRSNRKINCLCGFKWLPFNLRYQSYGCKLKINAKNKQKISFYCDELVGLMEMFEINKWQISDSSYVSVLDFHSANGCWRIWRLINGMNGNQSFEYFPSFFFSPFGWRVLFIQTLDTCPFRNIPIIINSTKMASPIQFVHFDWKTCFTMHVSNRYSLYSRTRTERKGKRKNGNVHLILL